MRDQPPEEIERHVIQAIEKHRRLRDEALMLESQVEAAGDGDEARQTGRAFVSAMIAVHAQQTVVSTLLDILGYLPELPKKKPH